MNTVRFPSRAIIATIIRVPPVHSEERPADKAFHHRAPISIGMTMAAGNNRRTSVPPTLPLTNRAGTPRSVRAQTTPRESRHRVTAVCSAMCV